MAHIGIHPAPGLGELIPGSFVVPSNPIVPRSYIPRVGELLPASFPVPQNPLIAAMQSPPGYGMPNSRGIGCGCSPGCGSGMCGTGGLSGLSGLSELGSDCGCIGGMCGCGMSGLGQFDPVTLALIAGGLVLLYMVMAPGGSTYRQKRAELSREYGQKLTALRGRERGYKRVARGVGRGLSAAAARL